MSNPSEIFANILKVSLKIARCQKLLLNYEEALIVLKTCWKGIKKRPDRSEALLNEFFLVCNEYISVLILLNRLQEAHDLVAEAIDAIDISKKASTYQKKITSLVIYKGQIFLKLGYLDDAHVFFTRVQSILTDENATKNNIDNVLHMTLSEAVDYMECVLGICAINIEMSKYKEAEATLAKCEEVIPKLFQAKDNDLARRVKILRLTIARDTLDFKMRNEVGDQLSAIYQKYDHYRLLRCEDFMLFVKERIMYLIDDCKYDMALLRVENILSVLDSKKSSYWYQQYRLLQAKCLINMRKAYVAYEILQELLQNSFLKKDLPSLKDYRLFVDVHLGLGKSSS